MKKQDSKSAEIEDLSGTDISIVTPHCNQAEFLEKDILNVLNKNCFNLNFFVYA